MRVKRKAENITHTCICISHARTHKNCACCVHARARACVC